MRVGSIVGFGVAVLADGVANGGSCCSEAGVDVGNGLVEIFNGPIHIAFQSSVPKKTAFQKEPVCFPVIRVTFCEFRSLFS